MPNTKTDAISALETAIAVYEAVRSKLERVIAAKKFAGKDVATERNQKATVSRKLGHLNDVLNEIEAASVVVSAPSKAEIKAVAGHLKAIRDLAVRDAAVAAGMNLLKDALTKAGDLAGGVKA